MMRIILTEGKCTRSSTRPSLKQSFFSDVEEGIGTASKYMEEERDGRAEAARVLLSVEWDFVSKSSSSGKEISLDGRKPMFPIQMSYLRAKNYSDRSRRYFRTETPLFANWGGLKQ